MQLPPCGMYRLTFNKFHWVTARNGRELIDCIQFLWDSQQDCRRSTFLRKDDDRSAWGRKQEYSICFSSIMLMHKKLLLGRWCILVYSMVLSSHSHLQQLQRGCRSVQPHSQTAVTSRNSQVSHSTTATTHRIPLDIYPDAALWECYRVCDYLLSYRPWLFVEVDDRRDLRKNRRIFTSICLHCFPYRYRGPFISIDVARVYQGPSFDALPMQWL